MKYKIPDKDVIAYQGERILSFIQMKTITSGEVTPQEIMVAFQLPVSKLAKIRDVLIAAGKIEEIP